YAAAQRRGARRRGPAIFGTFADLVTPDSLLGRLIKCFTRFTDLHTKTLSQTDQKLIADLLYDVNANAYQSSDVFAAVCRYKQAVLAQSMACAETVRCQLPRAAGEISLAAPQQNEPHDTYWQKARTVAWEIMAVELQMLLDCMCLVFLPPCPTDPCDQRVEIACVTVRGDKIIDICNFSCRHYAGAFPSALYWLSIVPIVPFI